MQPQVVVTQQAFDHDNRTRRRTFFIIMGQRKSLLASSENLFCKRAGVLQFVYSLFLVYTALGAFSNSAASTLAATGVSSTSAAAAMQSGITP